LDKKQEISTFRLKGSLEGSEAFLKLHALGLTVDLQDKFQISFC